MAGGRIGQEFLPGQLQSRAQVGAAPQRVRANRSDELIERIVVVGQGRQYKRARRRQDQAEPIGGECIGQVLNVVLDAFEPGRDNVARPIDRDTSISR